MSRFEKSAVTMEAHSSPQPSYNLSSLFAVSPSSFAHCASFLSWEEREALPFINKSLQKTCSEEWWFSFLCSRLAQEHFIYVPDDRVFNFNANHFKSDRIDNFSGDQFAASDVKKDGFSWEQTFREFYKIKDFWTSLPATAAEVDAKVNESAAELALAAASKRNAEKEKFKVNVYARFRPLSANKSEKDSFLSEVDSSSSSSPTSILESTEVTLPLHQRLKMIKMSNNLKSNKQALQILAAEGQWFRSKWAGSGTDDNAEGAGADGSNDGSDKENKNKNSHLVINIEANENKRNKGLSLSNFGVKFEKNCARVETMDPISNRVVVVAPEIGLRDFVFDGVFPPQAKGSDIYRSSIRPLVVDFINGYNATALVYGQTGSGKSFTMFGSDDNFKLTFEFSDGIIPSACRDIVSAVQQRRDQFGFESQLYVSYVEIFGDYVTDLLRFGQRCGQSKVASHMFVLSGAAEVKVDNFSDVITALQKGDAQKRKAATEMNDRSTRAHALFIMRLEQRNPRTGVKCSSKLYLADLGGSEQVKKSGIDAGVSKIGGTQEQFSTGFQHSERMREAVNINLGLLALKKCIEALNNNLKYVPFQDSKLTMLLSDGLVSCKTSIIVCSRLESSNISETVATLRFGERCSLLVNDAGGNRPSVFASVLEELDRQIKFMEAEIRRKERWIEVKDERIDALAEDGTLEKAQGAKEIRLITKLVGAEKERIKLEDLLRKRSQFVGTPLDDLEDYSDNSSSSGGGSAVGNVGKSKKNRVMGFGKELAEIYGLGSKFDDSAEASAENARFDLKVDADMIPSTVRSRRGGAVGWKTEDQLKAKPEDLEKKAKTANRSKLVYSGISA